MEYNTAWDALNFAYALDPSHLTLGGGEPTLHPRFFDILRRSLVLFRKVWLATNGTKRNNMLRLANILQGEEAEYEEDAHIGPIYTKEDQLTVALSTDYFHNRCAVSDDVWELWHRMVYQQQLGFALRDVTHSEFGVFAVGRAKRTMVYTTNDTSCICAEMIIEPDGAIKHCGCANAPKYGTIWNPAIPDDYNWRCCHEEELCK